MRGHSTLRAKLKSHQPTHSRFALDARATCREDRESGLIGPNTELRRAYHGTTKVSAATRPAALDVSLGRFGSAVAGSSDPRPSFERAVFIISEARFTALAGHWRA